MRMSEVKEGLILEVFVKPSSKEFRLVVDEDEIVVYCKEDPVGGKVNRELTKEFRRLFRREVQLVSGFASRRKKLLLRGAKKNELERLMLK